MAGKSVHPNFSLDVSAEINFFLDQCMDAASQVADAITLTENTGIFNPLSDSEYSGWNPYFEMFSAEDMSGYSEVLFWKDYLRSGSINISHGAPNYIYSGGNNGMLRSYVQTFLMENGLPWYADNSGFKGDSRIQEEKKDVTSACNFSYSVRKTSRLREPMVTALCPSSANLLSLSCKK